MGNLKRKLASFIAVFSLSTFVILLPSFLKIDHLSNFDILVSKNISGLWSPTLTSFFIIVTEIGNINLLLPLSLLIFIFLVYRNYIYESVVFVLSTIGGAISVFILKELTKIPRLEVSLVHESSFSFPSGHTTMATIFFLVIGYIVRDHIENFRERMFFETACMVLVILVGFSRIYLGVHRPTEVVAGFILGVFSVSASISIGHYFGRRFFRGN